MVKTRAADLAMIEQTNKKQVRFNPNWRKLGILNIIIFLDIKVQKKEKSLF